MFSPRLRRDENDTAPIALQHALHIGARQPHARHHIGLEEPGPVFVGNLEEILRLENTGVIDEDVHLRQRGGQAVAARGGGDVGGNAPYLAARHCLSESGNRGIDLGLGPAIDHDSGAGRRQALGDRVPDSGGRACHQCGFSGKIDLHCATSNVGRAGYRVRRTEPQSGQSMIRKSGYRFSEKIMLTQRDRS